MTAANLNDLAQRSLAIIMGGGAGTRLFPLTKERAKPAVPLGGKYRLVDIPISNCLNSGLRQIYVLTQFNTTSLHQHIHASYKFDHFSPTRSFVEILAAQQTQENPHWYQGTADAVRQNLRYFLEHRRIIYVILSGDQLYHMDYRELLRQHVRKRRGDHAGHGARGARGGVANSASCTRMPTGASSVSRKSRRSRRVLDELTIPPDRCCEELGRRADEELYPGEHGHLRVQPPGAHRLAGENEDADFGKHVIPTAIEKHRVHSYIFQGYWEDIGTIRAFFEANLALTDIIPPYSFFDREAPIYTRPRFLPASKINGVSIRNAIISDGCILTDARLERCVIGIRSIISSGAELRDVVLMGADYYEGDPRERAGAGRAADRASGATA